MKTTVEQQFNELKNEIVKEATKVNTISKTPLMGKEKALTAASYMLRLKRDNYEKKATENQIKNLIQDFLIIANCFISDDDYSELNNIINEIKTDSLNICNDISSNKISSTSQVNSRLDVTTMNAIYVDIIYDELVSTYKFLKKQKHNKLTTDVLKQIEEKMLKAKQKKQELNLIIETQLNTPINQFKKSKSKAKTR